MARLIVHLAPYLQGGAGRTISTLAIAQRRRGDDVIVATSKTAEPGFENYAEYLSAIRSAGITLITVDSLFKRDPSLNHAALDAITAALSGRTPSIVHTHAAIASRIGLQLPAPVVQTMHGWSRHKSAEHAAEDLAIMQDVSAVVCPSRASEHELANAGGRFKHTACVPNGIDPDPVVDALPESLIDIAERRKQGVKVLLTIGSLTTQKHQRIAIEALPRLLESTNVMLVCVGEGPELPQLVALATSLGVGDRVQLIGYLPQAAAALAVADVLIQPSLAESFGIAVVEAFRAGVPVIASDIPALRELVGDSRCGWMFDASSSDALAMCVSGALTQSADDRLALAARARELFLNRFTNDRMIDGYDAIYRAVMR